MSQEPNDARKDAGKRLNRMNRLRSGRYLARLERIRQARVRSAMILVAQKIHVLREIERLLSLAADDFIPCAWLNDIVLLIEENRADVYTGLTLADLRAILTRCAKAADNE